MELKLCLFLEVSFGVLEWIFVVFFFNDTATTEIYTLSLHDALPISHSEPRDTVEIEIFVV